MKACSACQAPVEDDAEHVCPQGGHSLHPVPTPPPPRAGKLGGVLAGAVVLALMATAIVAVLQGARGGERAAPAGAPATRGAAVATTRDEASCASLCQGLEQKEPQNSLERELDSVSFEAYASCVDRVHGGAPADEAQLVDGLKSCKGARLQACVEACKAAP